MLFPSKLLQKENLLPGGNFFRSGGIDHENICLVAMVPDQTVRDGWPEEANWKATWKPTAIQGIDTAEVDLAYRQTLKWTMAPNILKYQNLFVMLRQAPCSALCFVADVNVNMKTRESGVTLRWPLRDCILLGASITELL